MTKDLLVAASAAGGLSSAGPPTPAADAAHGRHEAYSNNFHKLGAALFYGVSSMAIMFVNKTVLSIYAFPSSTFLALSQFTVTTVILLVLKKAGKVSNTREA